MQEAGSGWTTHGGAMGIADLPEPEGHESVAPSAPAHLSPAMLECCSRSGIAQAFEEHGWTAY